MQKFLGSVKNILGKVGAFFKKAWGATCEFCKKTCGVVADFTKKCLTRVVELWNKLTRNVNWKVVWDKCTTGLLILLMCSPIFILGYIFLWFIVFRGI